MADDYTILAAPRISKAGFAAVLHAAGSPAAPVAEGAYDAIVEHGVDPCLELAMFRKESSFGTTGVARGTHSWGNNTDGHGQFVQYTDWVAGAAGTAWQLAVYGQGRIRPGTKTDTARSMPYVWAPAADHNAPEHYGDELVAWMDEWIAQWPASPAAASSGDAGDGPPAPTPAEPSAPAEPPAPAGAIPARYTVQPGDTLSGIAERFTGDQDRWHELYSANHGAIGSNPDLIHPGLVLRIPAAWHPQGQAAKVRTYTVQPGDTLSGIAERFTGDQGRWHELYDANHGAIGSNPDLIHPGLVLRIPAAW